MNTLLNTGEMDQSLLGFQMLERLKTEHGSSFYLLNVAKLRENYWKIENAFRSKYEKFIIGYSYKTNYLPFLCKELSKLGAFAEVVSRLEYDLAIKIGEDPKKIIFNGPIKSKDDIFYALENESIVNLDSCNEIEYVKQFSKKHKDRKVKIGLRVNFDITVNGCSPLQDGYENSRFGICIENGDLQHAINDLQAVENIRIAGLHAHFSTRKRSVETYRLITQKLSLIAKESLVENVEYIDIGGGIYGELPSSFQIEAPSFDDYAEVVCEVMNKEWAHLAEKPALILEPGISMVANTFLFITKVIDVKKVKDKHFVVVDGSIHNIKPTMHDNELPLKIVRRDKEIDREKIFQIVGYTCMEKDYLAHKVKAQLPNMADYIVFENVGAYTIVFNPPFIKERPAIVAVEQDEIFVVRRKETFKQFFNEDIYCF